MKKGFTLVELMVSVAVVAILVSIVVIAAAGAIASSRERRAEAARTVLQQGIETYYAQEGKWPDVIEERAKNMDEDTYVFTGSEADKIFQQVVGKAYGKGGGSKSMLLDPSGLFVCEASSCGNGHEGCYDNHSDKNSSDYCGGKGCRNGIDFLEAVRKGSKRHIQISNMSFGYQGKREGKFCKYKVKFSAKTDSIKVYRREDGYE